MRKEESPIGITLREDDLLLFWGKRDGSLQDLQREFPSLQFARVHQVHGDALVEAPAAPGTKADAHMTLASNLALVIATADCLPIMLHDGASGWISALHAGWRGIENRIVPKALRTLRERGLRPEGLRVWVGPHISATSFEVQSDVRDLLLASAPSMDTPFSKPSSKPGHHLVDLQGLLLAQLLESGVQKSSIEFFQADTLTDVRFHSFRRDREFAGRNLSFIAKCP